MPPEINSQNIDTQSTEQKKKILLWLKYFLIFVFVCFVALYLLNFIAKKFVKNISEIDRMGIAPNSQAITADKFADWKTYRSEEYGFEFKYPPEELIREHRATKDQMEIFIESISMGVRKSTYTDESSDWYLDTPPNGELELWGIIWKTFFLSEGYCDGPGCTLPIYAIQTRKNDIIYSINIGNEQRISDLQKQILSTFKFTE